MPATIAWVKDGAGWICRVPPNALFTLKLRPTGDGRWAWEIMPQASTKIIASGVVNSLGAAKTVTANYVNRSGLV